MLKLIKYKRWLALYTGIFLFAVLSLYPEISQATRSSTYHHRADRFCNDFTNANHLPANQCIPIRRNNGVCPRGYSVVKTFGGPVRGWRSCVAVNTAANARCANFLGKNPELQCRVLPSTASCGPGFKHDKTYGPKQTCIPGHRHSAELYCADYTRLHPDEQCRVRHRGRLCPKGFIHGHKYGRIGKGYKACIPGSKMGLVKRGVKKVGNAIVKVTPPIVPPFVPTLDPGSLVSYYKIYFTRVKNHANGTMKLPNWLINRYQREYKNNLRNVRVTESSEVHGTNAMTDCKTIYFPAGSGMKENILRETLAPATREYRDQAQWLFHELTHTEQCREVGGRNNYAMKWFSHLGVSLVKTAAKGQKFNEQHMHDNFPMEKQADAKGDRLKVIYRREHP